MIRSLLTAILVVVFAVTGAALALLDGAVRTAADADAVVAVARSAGMREGLVDATEAAVYEQVAADPQLRGLSRPELRAIVDGIMDAEWFEGSVRSGHAALEQALTRAADSAVVDLRPTKQALAGAAASLEQRAGGTCVRLLGPDACADDVKAQALVSAWRQRVDEGIASIPDRVDLIGEAHGQVGRDLGISVDEARALAARARTWRLAGLAVLAGILVLIALVNLTRPGRMLVGLGSALIAAACLLVIAGPVGRWTGEAVAEQAVVRARRVEGGDREAARLAVAATARFAVALGEEAAAAERGRAVLAAAVGSVLLALGLLARRR